MQLLTVVAGFLLTRRPNPAIECRIAGEEHSKVCAADFRIQQLDGAPAFLENFGSPPPPFAAKKDSIISRSAQRETAVKLENLVRAG